MRLPFLKIEKIIFKFMNIYERKILPHLVDTFCSSGPTLKQRQKIIPRAKGNILEVGIGTGLNISFYDPKKVNKIWGLEPSRDMQILARKAINKTEFNVNFITMPCEELNMEDNSFDTIVFTYVLCTIPNLKQALTNIHRVLKPNGMILFSEHGIAPDKYVQTIQNFINPIWKKIAGGCNLNRNIPKILESSGFEVYENNQMYIPGYKFASYNFWGEARKKIV